MKFNRLFQRSFLRAEIPHKVHSFLESNLEKPILSKYRIRKKLDPDKLVLKGQKYGAPKKHYHTPAHAHNPFLYLVPCTIFKQKK